MAYICCICQDHIQHNTKRHNEKTIINTTRGDQTDDVVNMNNMKLVIMGDKDFMGYYHSTQQKETQQ